MSAGEGEAPTRGGANPRGLLSILIPVYNERAYLRRCVERVLSAPIPEGLDREVVLVDDASTDGTTDIVRRLAEAHPGVLRAFFQEKNQGKGAAIRRAIGEMRGQYAVFQDADLEYDPRDYPALLEPILRHGADVVYGSRFALRSMRRVLNYHHQLGNKVLTTLSNWFTGLNLSDMETCYKAFRADVLRTIPIRSDRFGMEPEITAKVAKRGCVIYEVPISYHGRGYLEGKKIGWKDGFSAIYLIVKFWLIDDCFDERAGHRILRDLSSARRFNRWMARVVAPHLGQHILEVGAGIGNLSRHLPRREHLTVSDRDPAYLAILEDAYRENDLVDVVKLDLASDADFENLRGRRFDTVVCLNVLEHVEDDAGALRRMAGVLESGGNLVVLVPQFPALYGSYDKALGHCRRYRARELRQRLADAGLDVTYLRGFNAFGAVGWWLNARLLRRDNIGRVQLWLFDRLVPLTAVLERVLPLPGLSIVSVGRKRSIEHSSLSIGH